MYLTVKNYRQIAATIQRIHATMYTAVPTNLGVCLFVEHPCNLQFVVAFLEGHNFLKPWPLKFHIVVDDGVICIR